MNRSKLLVGFAALALALSACSGPNNPEPSVPTKTISSPSVETTEPTTDPATVAPETTEPTRDETTKPEEPASPAVSPTSDAAAPPATQFAQRWGQKYPNVPEYAILKAANAVCKLTNVAAHDWTKDPVILAGVNEVAETAGLSENDGLEFALDANQNYCGSVSNPT